MREHSLTLLIHATGNSTSIHYLPADVATPELMMCRGWMLRLVEGEEEKEEEQRLFSCSLISCSSFSPLHWHVPLSSR